MASALGLAIGGMLGWSPAGAAVDAAAIARQGNGQGAAACQTCHGADGAGLPGTAMPRLASLDAAYLRKQLDDFATGTRISAVMQPMAQALSPPARQALSRFYARMPVPAALAHPNRPVPAPGSVGAVLATRGRWSHGLPACEQCHGPAGIGVGTSFPPLAGQPAAYLVAQLQAWKQGTRGNDPLELMQHVSAGLSPTDMRAVAAWFAAQPLAGAEGSP